TTAEMGFLAPVTAIQENNFNALTQLYNDNRLALRISAMIFASDYNMAKWGVEFGKKLANTDRFKFQGIKLMTDGGAEGASLLDPYMVIEGLQENPDFHGVEIWSQGRKDEFRKVMQLCVDEKLMLQTHINGDKSARDIISLLAEQGEKDDLSKLNWTICHLPFATDEQLDLIKKNHLNVTVQHQPYLLGLNMRRFWGDARANSQENYRKYIDKGLRMGGGTDYPIGPANPFPCIQFMVDRTITDGSLMGPESAITIEEAVYLWTQGSANVEGSGDVLGSIEPGKKADLAVLNQDIFTIPTEKIGKTTVSSTWLGGKCVYRQECPV
ncbi:MAG: amidohydrolase family protein, partial [Oscillospiraceae bacterium]